MNVVIRADSSVHIGSGHVMRCLSLANELSTKVTQIHFICRNLKGHIGEKIEEQGHKLTLLDSVSEYGSSSIEFPWQEDAEQVLNVIDKQEIEWLIVDHYYLDIRWHKQLRTKVNKIMVVDDLANRSLDCELLLDQTYERKPDDYKSLVPQHCKIIVGSKYALVRPEFYRLRPEAVKKRQIFKQINNILISMGSMDASNVTCCLLDVLELINWKQKTEPVVHVVLNRNAPFLSSVMEIKDQSKLKINVLTDVTDMAALMIEADLAFGGCGTTSWERCTLGLPSIVIGLAENQNDILKILDEKKVHFVLSNFFKRNEKEIADEIEGLINNHNFVSTLVKNSFAVCDGKGVKYTRLELVPYVAKDKAPIKVRDVELDDADILFKWQCHPETRKYANNPEIPTRQEHKQWFENKLTDKHSFFWVILHGKDAAGTVRLEPEQIGDKLGYLVSINIEPPKFGMGIGTATLNICKDLFIDAILFAQVREENQASINLFTHAGFKYNKNINHYEWIGIENSL